MRRLVHFITAALICSLFARGSASAQADPFYQGKTLRIIVGSTPGAGNDIRTRLFARHAPKHLPGKPDIIVENMGSAGGQIARNYLYNMAKSDGLTDRKSVV